MPFSEEVLEDQGHERVKGIEPSVAFPNTLRSVVCENERISLQVILHSHALGVMGRGPAMVNLLSVRKIRSL
jgi:hypothetical protein